VDERPRLLLSACLLGQAVRYDGGHKHAPELVEALGRFAELIPLCPEAGAGLGIPRPPVALHQQADAVHMRGLDDPAFDPTARVNDWCRQQAALLATVDGCVLKARSPSCGIGSAPLHHPDGRETLTDGLFAAYVRAHRPELPMADEETLRDPAQLAAFREGVLSYTRREE